MLGISRPGRHWEFNQLKISATGLIYTLSLLKEHFAARKTKVLGFFLNWVADVVEENVQFLNQCAGTPFQFP